MTSINIRVFVVAITSEGNAEILHFMINQDQETIATGGHYDIANEMAHTQGYTAVAAFDENDLAGQQLLGKREIYGDSKTFIAQLPEYAPIKIPRVLVTVSGGVADTVQDNGVEVEVFDHDDFEDDPHNYGGVSLIFADLALPLGIKIEPENIFELTLVGFDGGTDETDHLIVNVQTPLQIDEFVKVLESFDFYGKRIKDVIFLNTNNGMTSPGESIDFVLPAQYEEFKSKIVSLTENVTDENVLDSGDEIKTSFTKRDYLVLTQDGEDESKREFLYFYAVDEHDAKKQAMASSENIRCISVFIQVC